jgi:hypothetical protein
MQQYGRKVPYFQLDIWHGDFGPHRVFKMESSNFLMTTWRSTALSNDDATPNVF